MLSKIDIDYGFDQNDYEEMMDSFSEAMATIHKRKLLLNDNRIMVVYSDNTDEKTYDVYPESLNFNPEVDTTEIVPYSSVKIIL